jgi:hypothetical protein
MQKTLSELKKMLDEHYRNEARIMNEIHESKLSPKENKELEEYANNHPYTKVVDLIQNTLTK